MSPPPLPQFTASSLPDISSLSWHLVHLAGGHEFLHALPQPINRCVMFPGEISCCHAKVCAFVLIPYDTQAQKRGPKREIYSRHKYIISFALDAELAFYALCDRFPHVSRKMASSSRVKGEELGSPDRFNPSAKDFIISLGMHSAMSQGIKLREYAHSQKVHNSL